MTDWPARAKEVEVELISAVVCGPSHSDVFFAETDDMSELAEVLRPYMRFTKADIIPLRDLMNPRQ